MQATGTMNPNMFLFLKIARSIACVVALVASKGPFSVIQKLLGMVGKVVCFHIHVFFKPRIFLVVLIKVKVGPIT